MPRAVAQSSTEVTIAPDWATKARWPGGREMREAGVQADRRAPSRPAQSAPTMRRPCRPAASSIACRRSSPAVASAPKPAVMTTAARVPRAAERGDQVRHRRRRGRDDRQVRHRWQRIRRRIGKNAFDRLPCCGLTGMIGPAKPALNRLWASTAPRERFSLLAPISADRSRFEKIVQIADAHSLELPCRVGFRRSTGTYSIPETGDRDGCLGRGPPAVSMDYPARAA